MERKTGLMAANFRGCDCHEAEGEAGKRGPVVPATPIEEDPRGLQAWGTEVSDGLPRKRKLATCKMNKKGGGGVGWELG